jgi:hypothetical protein
LRPDLSSPRQGAPAPYFFLKNSLPLSLYKGIYASVELTFLHSLRAIHSVKVHFLSAEMAVSRMAKARHVSAQREKLGKFDFCHYIFLKT